MKVRHTRTIILFVALIVIFVIPQFILAATGGGQWPQWAVNMIGISSLGLAVALMLDVIALGRVAEGSAIADNISYLILGVVCLAASVLFGWVGVQLPLGMSSAQAQLAEDGLVMVSMALLAIYFYRLYSALSGYLKSARAYAESLAAPTESAEE
jgi:hypothetical protein